MYFLAILQHAEECVRVFLHKEDLRLFQMPRSSKMCNIIGLKDFGDKNK